jgi:erythromycin esterase
MLHTSKTGSWNETLINNRTGNFYLNFSRLTEAEQNEFNKQRPLKLLGYGLEDDKASAYYDISLARLFDVLIFLKETNQTTALFN